MHGWMSGAHAGKLRDRLIASGLIVDRRTEKKRMQREKIENDH